MINYVAEHTFVMVSCNLVFTPSFLEEAYPIACKQEMAMLLTTYSAGNIEFRYRKSCRLNACVFCEQV